MRCHCGKTTRVVESRESGKSVRRRRECSDGHRFSTTESVVYGTGPTAQRTAWARILDAAPLQARLATSPAWEAEARKVLGDRTVRRIKSQEFVRLDTVDRLCVETDVDLNDLYPMID